MFVLATLGTMGNRTSRGHDDCPYQACLTTGLCSSLGSRRSAFLSGAVTRGLQLCFFSRVLFFFRVFFIFFCRLRACVRVAAAI